MVVHSHAGLDERAGRLQQASGGRKFLAVVALVLLGNGHLCAEDRAPYSMRTWTDLMGRKVEALLRGVEGEDVVLGLGDGSIARFPLKSLSESDQGFVAEEAPRLAQGAGSTIPVRANRGGWPREVTVRVDLVKMRTVVEEAASKRFVYESPFFRIISSAQLQPQAVVGIGMILEAEREMLRVSPWGLHAAPTNGRLTVELFETLEQYLERGGAPRSSGVYLLKDKTCLLPFSAIGLSPGALVTDYRPVIHELAHMMNHDLLRAMPRWVSVGMAEYIASIPFKKSATFATFYPQDSVAVREHYSRLATATSGGNALLAALGGGAEASFVRTMQMTWRDWRNQSNPGEIQESYDAACALVYYFSQLEGDKRGSRFLNFLDACSRDKPLWDAYEAAVEGAGRRWREFLQKPGVKDLGDGKVSFPPGLTPPESPRGPYGLEPEAAAFVHMKILLGGKTPEQVATEARNALQAATKDWNSLAK